MTVAVARAIVALAARSLGPDRAAWAAAMTAELEAAVDDGAPLGFALGCLLAAWRELPASAEGRLAVAGHALALGAIVPAGALAFWGAWLGYPVQGFGSLDGARFVAGHSARLPLLNAGDGAIAPALLMVVLLLGAAQLLLAWALLGRDWAGVAKAMALNVSAVATLALVTGLIGLGGAMLLVPSAIVAAEALALAEIREWHRDLTASPERGDMGG